MDEKEFKTRAARLEAIAKVLEKLPNEIRAAAFDLVKGYVSEQSKDPTKKTSQQHEATDDDDDDDDDGSFFGKFAHDKPADNAKLIAANFYRKYGSAPFSMDEVRQCANEVGITIPDRVDATFSMAQDKGHKLFVSAGRGKYKPTVHGETSLKAAYSVKKGTKVRPKAAE
jgi:hypothetical protein